MQECSTTENNQRQAFELAVRLLSLRQHSQQEIIAKLQNKGHSVDAAEHAVRRLHELQLLDDLEFSRSFIRSRCRTRPSGSYKLRFELRNKGVEDHIIDQALEDFDSREACMSAAKKKLPLLRGERQQRERKLHAHLMSRGFGTEEIREILQALQNQESA